MKKIALIAAMAAALVSSFSAQAATASGTFDVVLNLTSKCEINGTTTPTGAVISDLTLSYTSFQTTAATASTNFSVRCTNGLSYGMALSAAGATDDALNLAYELNLSSSATHATGDNASLTGLTGSSTPSTFYVHGTVTPNQPGTCATTTCTNAAATNRGRTLTITY
jgi:hypothetical protein